jgi:23S rRNA pseudouridine1911/1915/1917 synthase
MTEPQSGLCREEFWINPPLEPQVVAEAPSYLVLYKPPRMHTSPLRPGEGRTLLAWAAQRYPEVVRIRGRKEHEGGLVHRLDYETQGLVLCARTEGALNSLLEQQEAGNIIKEYEAVSGAVDPGTMPPGFPPGPAPGEVIESAFRPFGKGRKEVRPVTETSPKQGGGKAPRVYRTEILFCDTLGGRCFFRLRIRRGFRHQIRCHLAWIGRPLLNDPLYGNSEGAAGFLALRASSLAFTDPGTGKEHRVLFTPRSV